MRTGNDEWRTRQRRGEGTAKTGTTEIAREEGSGKDTTAREKGKETAC